MTRLALRSIRALPHSVRCSGALVVLLLILMPMLTTVATAQELRQPDLEVTEEPTIAAPDLPIRQELPPTPTPTATTEPPIRIAETEVPPATEVPELGEPPMEGGGTASLTVTKGVCPPFYDPFTGNPTVDCTETLDGVTFDLDNHDAGELDLQAVTGDVVSGAAVFADVAPGTWTLSEQVPAGYDQPFLWTCFDQNDPGLVAPPLSIINNWELEIVAGQDLLCAWYNVEDNTNHTIRVTKLVCPEGFDPTSDVWTFQDQCDTPLPGVDFTMTTDGGAAGGTTDAQGRIEWTDVDLGASGQIQLDEDIPDGYGEPVVWCVSFPEAAADPEDFDYVQVAAVDGLVSVSPAQNEPYIFGCAFYNFLDAAEGGEAVEHQITVTKRACPAGTDPNQGIAPLLAQCEIAPGVEFTLEFGGGATSTTETDATGVVSWAGLPYGEFEILETNYASYAQQVAYCEFEGFGFPWNYVFTDGVYDGSFDLGVHPEDGPQHLMCDWFNIEAGEGGATVTVIKHLCPLGVPEDTTIDQYIVICAALFDGIGFTLEHAGGSFPGETGEDGQVEWPSVPAGEIEIHEAIPDGYKDPLAFCTVFDGEQELESGQVDATGGAIPLDIPADATSVVCHVFNIPVPTEGGEVHVVKLACPEGIAPSDDAFALGESCLEDAGAVTVQVTGPDGYAGEQATSGGVPNTAVFEDVPFGTIEVSETVPDGYGTPLIFCLDTTSDVPDTYVPATVVDGDTASWEHVADAELPTTCLIFNFPENPNEVEIHKWACPEGFDPNSSDQEFIDTCTDAMDGVAFALTTESGVEALDTVGGLVVFGGIGAESIGIQETIPEGFGNPYVICEFEGEWADWGANGGYVEHLFTGGGETLVCHWFNLHGGSGDLTIHKWTCPAGYDLHAEGADPAADCTEATNGIPFQFGRSEAAMIDELQTTGDVIDGGVFFDDLEPDVYKVVELVPDGIASVFVLECTGHLMGQLQPYPLSDGNVLDGIDIDAGEHLVCHWFNVPEQDPNTGDLTLVKYVCGTEIFVSEVDCETFEDGQGFDLSVWDGDSYAWIDSRVTDGFGVIAWSGLVAGTYRLDEVDATWCHIASEVEATPGGGYAVEAGQETVVHVYNCTGEPGKPGDTPTKYPNTGVAPVVSELPVTGMGQATSGAGDNDRSIFGPLSGIVGVLVLVGRFYFVIQRGRAERERREEEAWAAEAAARRERPAWMSADSGSSPTERPDWLGRARNDDRPDWMSR